MSIETIKKRVKPMFGSEFDLILSYPVSLNEKKRSPITCFVSKNGSNTEFGAYIYSIINPKSAEVHQTVLNNSDEQLLDVTKRLSSLITKKYGIPSYVSFSGSIELQESIMFNKEILRLIDQALQSNDSSAAA